MEKTLSFKLSALSIFPITLPFGGLVKMETFRQAERRKLGRSANAMQDQSPGGKENLTLYAIGV